jgi:hypothetical protein
MEPSYHSNIKYDEDGEYYTFSISDDVTYKISNLPIGLMVDVKKGQDDKWLTDCTISEIKNANVYAVKFGKVDINCTVTDIRLKKDLVTLTSSTSDGKEVVTFFPVPEYKIVERDDRYFFEKGRHSRGNKIVHLPIGLKVEVKIKDEHDGEVWKEGEIQRYDRNRNSYHVRFQPTGTGVHYDEGSYYLDAIRINPSLVDVNINYKTGEIQITSKLSISSTVQEPVVPESLVLLFHEGVDINEEESGYINFRNTKNPTSLIFQLPKGLHVECKTKDFRGDDQWKEGTVLGYNGKKYYVYGYGELYSASNFNEAMVKKHADFKDFNLYDITQLRLKQSKVQKTDVEGKVHFSNKPVKGGKKKSKRRYKQPSKKKVKTLYANIKKNVTGKKHK